MGRKPKRQETRLSDGDRERPGRIAKDPQSIQKHVWRVRTIPGLGSGGGAAEAMRRTGKCRPAVGRWWDRFLEQGVDGLLRDATRPPGLEPTPEGTVRAVAGLAIPPPPPRARHWTLQALGRRLALTAPDVPAS